ncbi:hypothetical protein HMPREF2883_03655 [Actinomyces sp. HMSC075C01]|nr:hypothetical protein HMPREF2883_03655 [Actinomyces sp. HMSC075C01]
MPCPGEHNSECPSFLIHHGRIITGLYCLITGQVVFLKTNDNHPIKLLALAGVTSEQMYSSSSDE